MTTTIYLTLFCIFGLAALLYGSYAVYIAFKDAKEQNSRPDFDSDRNMFHFRRPEIASQVRFSYYYSLLCVCVFLYI